MRPFRPIITPENIAAAKLLELLIVRCCYFRRLAGQLSKQ